MTSHRASWTPASASLQLTVSSLELWPSGGFSSGNKGRRLRKIGISGQSRYGEWLHSHGLRVAFGSDRLTKSTGAHCCNSCRNCDPTGISNHFIPRRLGRRYSVLDERPLYCFSRRYSHHPVARALQASKSEWSSSVLLAISPYRKFH